MYSIIALFIPFLFYFSFAFFLPGGPVNLDLISSFFPFSLTILSDNFIKNHIFFRDLSSFQLPVDHLHFHMVVRGNDNKNNIQFVMKSNVSNEDALLIYLYIKLPVYKTNRGPYDIEVQCFTTEHW